MVKVKFCSGFIELMPTKIIGLLRNYSAHAREMGKEIPSSVNFFLKPPSTLLPNGGTIQIPSDVRELHHEVELALIIGKEGRFVSKDVALEHVKAYMIILDITARDIQARAKRNGLPWSCAKGYDTFAPVSPRAYPADEYDWREKRIWLDVNGEHRQEGNTTQMIFGVETIICQISKVMTLYPGDIILTGTPSGVGQLFSGDVICAGMEGMEDMTVNVL